MLDHRLKQNEVVAFAIGATLVVGGGAGTIAGATAISFGLNIATQAVAGMALTDLLILGGTLSMAVGGFVIGIHTPYPQMLAWTALWAVVFSITVSTFSTALLYSSLANQALTWFCVTTGATASILGISNHLAKSKHNIVINDIPLNIVTTMSIADIALCAGTIGVFSATAATALPYFSNLFIQQPAFILLVNVFSTAAMAELLVGFAAIKETYIDDDNDQNWQTINLSSRPARII